jgi:hypothetical protein
MMLQLFPKALFMRVVREEGRTKYRGKTEKLLKTLTHPR